MISIESVESNGIILGITLSQDNDPKIKVALPDRYIGDGNDIAEAVLMVLLRREIEKQDIDLRLEINTFLVLQRFGFGDEPSSDDDNVDWSGEHDNFAPETLSDDDFYYHYTP